MVLGAAFDLNVMSYPVLIIMKAQGVLAGRGGAGPRTSGEADPSHRGSGEVEPSPRGSGEAEPALSHRARRSQPSDVRRGEASP